MQKIDPEQLNARAFGEDPQEVIPSDTSTTDVSQTESGEKKEQSSSGTAPVVEEQKVPYSRMKSVLERARLAEERAEEAGRRLDELERTKNRTNTNEPYEEAIASRIKKLYGDNDTSKEIIEIEIANQKRYEEIAEQKAYEALDKRESGSRAEIEQNERILENKMEDFSMTLGRDLSDTEQDELLSIADKYSPVGEDGKYLSGEPLPLDRAWEIYEMQLASKGQSAKKARSQATAFTGSKSEGETSTESGDTDTWYPGRWRDRIRGK